MLRDDAMKRFNNRLVNLDILVVDDATDIRILIGHILSKAGANVDFAQNGLEALESISKKSYDVVFMDIRMPQMGGLEAIKILRANSYDKPIVALTADSISATKESCLDAGFSEFLLKPLRSDDLFSSIDRVSVH